jgi:hypothetical protein
VEEMFGAAHIVMNNVKLNNVANIIGRKTAPGFDAEVKCFAVVFVHQ